MLMANPARKVFAPIPPDVERVGKAVLDAAYRVHTALGPGLLESVYETTMGHVLRKSRLLVETQVVSVVSFVFRDLGLPVA